METISLIEHETVPIVDRRSPGQRAFSQAQANTLARLEAQLPAGTFRWGHGSVTFAQYCGVIALGDLALEILPKIYGKETDPGSSRAALIRMLYKAKRLRPRRGGIAGIALQKHVLLDVFMLHFCEQLQAELMQGMIRSYVERQENLSVLRGRVRIEQQLKLNLAHRERLFCQYDELSIDNAYNQILKSVLQLLLKLVANSLVRKRVIELLMRFDAISDSDANIMVLDGLRFDRSNRRYESIFEQCRWILEGLHPDVLAGEASCLTLLFDMNRLFEAYVAGELRQAAWREGLRLREQGPQLYLATRDDTQDVFLMKPDMAILDTRNRVLVLADSKWKLLDEREKKLRIQQSDLYQMTSYAARYGVDRLALIYPRQHHLTRSIKLQLQGGSALLWVIPFDVTSSQEAPDLMPLLCPS